jgi:hypothetical protein
MTVISYVALKLGSSKHGKACLAYVASKLVDESSLKNII